MRRVSAEIEFAIHGFGKRSTPHMSNDKVVSLAAPAEVSDPLTELLSTIAP